MIHLADINVANSVVQVLTAFFTILLTGFAGWIVNRLNTIHRNTNARLDTLDTKLTAVTGQRDELQREQDLAVVPPSPPPVPKGNPYRE
jgi:hypothetical protein